MKIDNSSNKKLEKPAVIFQDESILVLSKPAGWVTTSDKTTKSAATIQDWVGETFDFQTSKTTHLRNGIVHRLDKDTSGLLLVAKTETAFENLQRQFFDRKVEKKYTALAHGELKVKKGTVKAEVGRLPWNKERFGILPGGRASETSYIVTKEYMHEKDIVSLIDLYPKTGRTHQIRIHLKFLGHPIVSDSFYAGRKTSRRDTEWCPRLFLHASEISFFHPLTEEKVVYQAQLPNDLQNVLNLLKPR